jgi:hypothetical protein
VFTRVIGVLAGCFILFIGLGMFTSALISFFYLPSSQTLQCKKDEANQAKCKFSYSRILTKDTIFFQIYGSKIEKPPGISSPARRARSREHRVLMSTSIGQTPLTHYYTINRNNENYLINKKINSFINNPGEKYLNIKKDIFLSAYATGLMQLILLVLIIPGGWAAYCMVFEKTYDD